MPIALPTPRVLRVAGSLAIVLAVYWAYALTAVPLIEPSADLHRDRPAVAESSRSDAATAESQLGELADLFEPDAWELDSPKIFQNDRMRLMFRDYRNLGGTVEAGFQVELNPLTIVITPGKPTDEQAEDQADAQARQTRRSVVLQVPEGALLKFDEPFELQRMKIGRLVGGELKKRVVIRSQGKSPGPEDDLLIVTHDVQLTQRQVRTSNPVEFRWGPNYGWGREMVIALLPGDKGQEAERRGPNIGGIESFELRYVQRLHLELDQAEDQGHDLPVEITCKGPFRFNLTGKVATFEDCVNVTRINPTGPCDQLQCELLSIRFTDRERPGKKNPKKAPGGSMDLKPQRIEALGNPVVVSAPSEEVRARGQRLQYHLDTNRIVLDGDRPVMLQQGPNEIHARSLDYRSAGPGRLGRILAAGPGWIRGRMEDRLQGQLEAQWDHLLQVRPDKGNQVISLTGDARLEHPEVGRLQAPEVHFYLLEVPVKGVADRYRLQSDRLLACQTNRQRQPQATQQGQPPLPPSGQTAPEQLVVIDSPQLSSVVKRLEVWFEHAPAAESQGRRPKARAPARDSSAACVSTLPSAKPVSPAAHSPEQAPAPQSEPTRQHFQVVGRLLRARVIVREEEQGELSELTIEDGVEFVESRTEQPNQQPMLIRGDWLHVVDGDKPYAAVTVIGKPAHFQGRGLALSGRNISLNRGTNRLWVDGPGRMELPLEAGLGGRQSSGGGVLEIFWQRRMVFDGRTARFEQAVTASTLHQYLQTETLDARFSQAIDFSEMKSPQELEPEIEQLICGGSVFMEGRDFEGRTQTSHQQMQAADMAVNLLSGVLEAKGPGWLTSVRRGSGELFGSATPTTGVEDDRRVTPAGGRENRLTGLHVRFQDRITGNVNHRRMTFHGQVQTAYATVDSWSARLDVDHPESLGPGGAVMQCKQLSVSETNAPTGPSRELEALGNVVVEGNTDDGTFAARAVRLTYDETKDLLVLEGDGRTDAKLFRQQSPGGPLSEFAARKIRYWPRTNRWLKVDGARLLQSRLPGGGSVQR